MLKRIKRFLNKNKRKINDYQRPVVIILAFAIVGTIMLVLSKAAVPNASIEAEKGTATGINVIANDQASGGQAIRFSNTTVRRFFADDASWNQTVTQIGGEVTQLKSFAERFYDYGGGIMPATKTQLPAPQIMRLSLVDYSVPIYDMLEATTTVKVFQMGDMAQSMKLSRTGVKNGDSIPWNPSWKAGEGNDAIMHIVNYQTGEAYELWMVHRDRDINCAGFAILGQFSAGKDLCLGAVEHYNNLWTAKDGSTIVGRGNGINNLALVTRADEVATGNIGHAIALTVSNPMFGPDLIDTADEPLTDLANAGTNKAFFMRPGTRLEHKCNSRSKIFLDDSLPMDATTRSKTIPSGMRFAAKLTENDITAWLDSKGYTGAKRQTAATFARAWRDYGGVVAETGAYGVTIETDGVIGPAKDRWVELGLYDATTKQQSNLDFSGLLTRDRLYVVKPPARAGDIADFALKPCK
ncbi:hypothetical protein KDA11_03405 [Candidatus Saccharibacteria bacterium]|nr:hypothetical protein [Candidatus Saccharibacteria bacterium]